jgi:hypothetical protein
MTKSRLDNVLFNISDYTLDALKTAQEPSDYADYIAGLAPRLELLKQMIKEAANEQPEQ